MKAKKNYYDMTKQELEKELKKVNKQEQKTKNITESGLGIGSVLIIILMVFSLELNLVIINDFISRFVALLSSAGFITGMVGFVKMHSTVDEIVNIKSQLHNIITMDYEKKRYKMEKEQEKQNTNDIAVDVNNRIDRINLLKEYKKELDKYNIGFDSKQIAKSIDNQEYVINELGGKQKVKK